MGRTAVVSAVSVLVLVLTGCKGDPKTPEYWDKQLNSGHRAKDKVRTLDDLRESGNANASFVPMLKGHLAQDKQPEVRGALARVLGSLRDPSAVDALTEAIDLGSTDSAENGMNKEIAGALAKIGDPKATPTLMRLIKSRDNYVRIEAINALGALKAKEAVDPLLDIVQDDTGEPFICKKAIQALGEIGDPKAVPEMIKMMFKERRGVSFYVESSYGLFQIGRPAGDILLAVLKGDHKPTWSWAKENNIVEAAVYAKSAEVLGDLRDARATPALLKYLGFNSEFVDLKLGVRVKVAGALGKIHAKEAVKPLSGMLEEEEANARGEYVRSLVMIGGRDAIPALEKAASKGSWDGREVSLRGLAMLGDERELGAFEKFLKEDPKLTEAECKENPELTGCSNPGELAKKHAEVIQAHVKRLEAAKECKSDAACWVKKLSDPTAGVHERAAAEIAHAGKGELVDELLKHLKEPDLEARAWIIQSADWLVTSDKAAARAAQASSAAIDKQLEEEHGKTEFVKVNEDLRRLAVDLKRASA